jgi:hypothetical protein
MKMHVFQVVYERLEKDDKITDVNEYYVARCFADVYEYINRQEVKNGHEAMDMGLMHIVRRDPILCTIDPPGPQEGE